MELTCELPVIPIEDIRVRHQVLPHEFDVPVHLSQDSIWRQTPIARDALSLNFNYLEPGLGIEEQEVDLFWQMRVVLRSDHLNLSVSEQRFGAARHPFLNMAFGVPVAVPVPEVLQPHRPDCFSRKSFNRSKGGLLIRSSLLILS